MSDEKIVIRFLDGRIAKGYLEELCDKAEELCFVDPDTMDIRSIRFQELKAVFFVKSFEGNRDYTEKKAYGARKPKGHRTFVKLTDGEDMVGFLDGDVPWERGFFLSRHTMKGIKGLYLLPADAESNNVKVFILAHAIKDATVVP